MNKEPEREVSLSEVISLLQSVSNRMGIVEKKIISMERDRKDYRKKREKKEETTLDVIKKEIQVAADKQELSKWAFIRERAIYLGSGLLLAWLLSILIK